MFTRLKDCLSYFFGFWVLVAISLQTWGVFSRNLLEGGTAWIDDLQRFNFIWLIWILGALVYGSRGLISLDLVQAKFIDRPRAFHAMTFLQGLLEFVFSGTFTFLAIQMFQQQLNSGEVTTVLRIPLWLLNLGFLIGCSLVMIFAIRKIVRAAHDISSGTPTDPEEVIPREA